MPSYVSNKTIEKLKYDLVRDKFISYEDLSRAEEISFEKGQCLSRTIVEENYIEEETLLKFIQDNLKIPYVNLEDYSLDEKCLAFVSADDARKHRILPLFKIENVLTVAMADPLNLFALNNLMNHVEYEVEPIICSERHISQMIEKYYSGQTSASEAISIDWRNELNEEAPDIKQAEKIVNAIISQALSEKIFEFVFEQTKDGLSVKFRQDKAIEDKGIIPVLLSSLCVTYIKNLCSLDVGVSNVPQLGKFTTGLLGEKILKQVQDENGVTGVVSTFPSTQGERIVIRLYRPPSNLNRLDVKNKEAIAKSLEKSGIVLIAGSKLSGKSFLAYSLLNSINSTHKNIMTIESIVKYDLKGVNQCELNEKVGFSAEKALKLIEFQNPDVVYIEEIMSGKLFEGILSLVNSGKLIITEINIDKIEKLPELFSPQELKELEKSLNCLVLVKALNDISLYNRLGC